MLDEACHVLRALWTEKRANFEGEHYTLTDAQNEPKPLQEPMPLWIGGSGEKRTLRIVAEHATGWNTFYGDPAEYRHKLDVLERHCADVGRDPAEIRKQVVDRGPTSPPTMTSEQLVEALRPHKDDGRRGLPRLRPPAGRLRDDRTIRARSRAGVACRLGLGGGEREGQRLGVGAGPQRVGLPDVLLEGDRHASRWPSAPSRPTSRRRPRSGDGSAYAPFIRCPGSETVSDAFSAVEITFAVVDVV